jgi:hypothetical protein
VVVEALPPIKAKAQMLLLVRTPTARQVDLVAVATAAALLQTLHIHKS